MELFEELRREYEYGCGTIVGLYERSVMVPQAYEWGVEAQVDWYEAMVMLDGTRQTVPLFAMRAMASGAAFHCAYPRATQQAFLEALVVFLDDSVQVHVNEVLPGCRAPVSEQHVLHIRERQRSFQ